jgi:hypothetical protein
VSDGGLGHDRPGFGLWSDGIEAIAGIDVQVSFFADDIINRPEKILLHLLLPEIDPVPGIEAAEGGEAWRVAVIGIRFIVDPNGIS